MTLRVGDGQHVLENKLKIYALTFSSWELELSSQKIDLVFSQLLTFTHRCSQYSSNKALSAFTCSNS